MFYSLPLYLIRIVNINISETDTIIIIQSVIIGGYYTIMCFYVPFGIILEWVLRTILLIGMKSMEMSDGTLVLGSIMEKVLNSDELRRSFLIRSS